MPTAILLIHAATTWYMVGLIWFVQIVHYPLKNRVARDGYRDYQRSHERLTLWVVGPPMIAELAASAMLVWSPPTGVSRAWTCIGAALVAIIWASTALLQVPAHRSLGGGFTDAAHRRLVLTNWLRTVAWSVRGVLALAWLAASAGTPG